MVNILYSINTFFISINNVSFYYLSITDATAVVQVEDTRLLQETSDNTEEKEIEIMTEVKSGQEIRYFVFHNVIIFRKIDRCNNRFSFILRPIGSDIKKGELILTSGTKLGPVELGLISACGYKEVSVTDLPVIGVLSTGDELQCPGTPLMPGRIYDSNKITLLSLLEENGFDPVDMGIALDE